MTRTEGASRRCWLRASLVMFWVATQACGGTSDGPRDAPVRSGISSPPSTPEPVERPMEPPIAGPAATIADPATAEKREGMVLVPAATRQENLSAYWLDLSEVTVADYERCVASQACKRPKLKGRSCNFGRSDKSEHPINCLDAAEATQYCESVGKRLPTREEWEHAARGIDGRPYPWGSEKVVNYASNVPPPRPPAPAHDRLCWMGQDHELNDRGGRQTQVSGTCPVGRFPQGASPYGALDMAGNVWEWTSTVRPVPYPKPGARILWLCGGGWRTDYHEQDVRLTSYAISDCADFSEDFSSDDFGVRCARTGDASVSQPQSP